MNYIIWIIIMSILLIVEASTANFVTIWFAIGALGATIASVCGLNLYWQIFVFTAVSALTLIFTKSFVKKKLKVETTKTNLDAVIGKTAIVSESITSDKFAGAVKVDGKEWSAICYDGDVGEGERVTVKEIKGVKLVVEKVKDTADI